MKIGIMQPYFFPYIGYWQLINAVDLFVIYDDVNYIKGGWINRNRFLVQNQEQLLTLDLKKPSPNRLIRDIELLSPPVKVLKTIAMSYRRAPHFKEVMPLLEEILAFPELNLAKFLESSIKKISAYLNISTKITCSSHLRYNRDLKGQDKVIDICRSLGCKHYINSINGTSLYQAEEFYQKDMRLSFLKSTSISYPQFGSEFIPWLSIVDVLMFNPVDKIQIFLNNYELINE